MRNIACSSAARLALLVMMSGCPAGPTDDVVCPPLAPGALASAQIGDNLLPLDGPSQLTGTLATGALAFHAVWVPSGTRHTVSVTASGQSPVLMAYGPRNAQGGFGGCSELSIAQRANETVAVSLQADTADSGGEYAVLVGLPPGQRQPDDPPVAYSVTAVCVEGCDAQSPCPTLSQRGCAELRCDGEIRRDDNGCPTCTCDRGALCDSGYMPGPGQSCVAPGCRCPEPGNLVASQVCGTDATTYRSACHARCAGSAIAKDGACEDVCPGLNDCQNPCYGRRAIDSGGCPTCDCAPSLPTTANECAVCKDDSQPVCGSDGVTYVSRCHARCAGVKILYATQCHSACLAVPGNCTLDCDWGYVLGDSPDSCLQCACENPPSVLCDADGEPVCVEIPAFNAPVTVGSACLAVHVGAIEGVWGSCGDACEADSDCVAEGPVRCARYGALKGRCILEPEGQSCGCSGLIEPACGSDGFDYENTCLAHCAGVDVSHRGRCCDREDPVDCPVDHVPELDTRGCLTDRCTAARVASDRCRSEPPQVDSCGPDGVSLQTTACVAHLSGLEAQNAWCPSEEAP